MHSRFGLASAVISVALIAAACSSPDPTLATQEPTPVPTSPSQVVAADPVDTASQAPTTESTRPTEPPSPQPPAGTPSVVSTPAPVVDATPGAATGTPDNQPSSSNCSAGLAGDPTSTAVAGADVDGDGAPDQITTYSLGSSNGGDPVSWRVRVDTASGESMDSIIESWTPGASVQPLGGADVDGDEAGDEIFIVVGSGASAVVVAIYVRVGCALVSARADGAPATFPVGGGIANIAGLQCFDIDEDGVNNTIVAWVGEADFAAAEGTYDVEGNEYQLMGRDLQSVGTRVTRANLDAADFTYSQLSCGAVGL